MAEEGEQLAGIMKQEVRLTTHGNAPGKPGWREDIERSIGKVATSVTATGISIVVGYSPLDTPDKVRAMIGAHGSGDKAEGGGARIHAGPPGRSVWNEDVTGKHPSKAKANYALPDAFNQQGNRFVENAVRRMEGRFGKAVDAAFASMPDSVVYEKVRVDEA